MDNDVLYTKLLEASFRYLKFRPRSEAEMMRYLQKKCEDWKAGEEKNKILNAVFDELKKRGLISDRLFVEWWVNERNLGKPRSVFLLKLELKNKGVSEDIIEEYFSEHIQDDLETAKKALIKKGRKILFSEKKSIEFLLRRGYSYKIAFRAFEELNKKY